MMNKTVHAIVAVVTLAAASTQALAASITPAIGATGQGQMTERLGLEFNWDKTFLDGSLSGYWDAGITNWEGGSKASARQSLSFSPVFVYSFKGNDWVPYVEAGIGVAAFSSTSVGDKNIGSAVHFEDRLGFGVKFKNESKLGFRAIHYSNAGLKEPNPGIESYTLFYTIPLK